jgi:hypothetical protein
MLASMGQIPLEVQTHATFASSVLRISSPLLLNSFLFLLLLLGLDWALWFVLGDADTWAQNSTRRPGVAASLHLLVSVFRLEIVLIGSQNRYFFAVA